MQCIGGQGIDAWALQGVLQGVQASARTLSALAPLSSMADKCCAPVAALCRCSLGLRHHAHPFLHPPAALSPAQPSHIAAQQHGQQQLVQGSVAC
jgi:hypothetical protein